MIDRLLIVGLGSIGSRHARIARQLLPDARISVLRHQSCQQLPAYLDGCFLSMEEALHFRPQAAVIASPASHHLEAAIPLAKAGVNLLIEKPLSNSTDGVADLIDTCRRHSAILMTAYNLRFLPSLQRFRQLILEGRVGKVLSVRAEVGQFLPSWRPGADYREGVSAQSRLGGGALLELSHEIDYLRWIFGGVTWVNATLLKQSDLEIDVEDTVHLLLGFESGKLVASVDLDFVRHDATRNCTVIGESGSLRWMAQEGRIELFEHGSTTWRTLEILTVEKDHSYLEEWVHYLDCIATGNAPGVSGEDGLSVLRVIESARASSNEGRVVRI